MAEVWAGQISYNDPLLRSAMVTSGPGWGMNYLVGGIYSVLGKNMFAAQSFCAVFGAATAPMVYFCAEKIFHNKRVAKLSALSIALFPAFIIWSSQLLKDGLIIFLLVLAMTMVLQLQEKFNYCVTVSMIFSLSGIITLGFIFFTWWRWPLREVLLSAFRIRPSQLSRSTIVLILMGLALTYLGVIRNASVDFERFGSLERVQISRSDLARSADSGFDEDMDVSTTRRRPVGHSDRVCISDVCPVSVAGLQFPAGDHPAGGASVVGVDPFFDIRALVYDRSTG